MEHCLVTVKREGREDWVDLELPFDQPAHQLVESLLKAMRWPSDSYGQNRTYAGLRLRVDPPGKIMGAEDTLESFGVKDGGTLTLVTSGFTPTAPAEAGPAAERAKPASQPDRGGQPSWLGRKLEE